MGWIAALFIATALGAWVVLLVRSRAATQRALKRAIGDLNDARRNETGEAARLRAIVESMTEGVMVVDGAHIIRFSNRALPSLLELRSDPVAQSVLQSVRDIAFEDLVSRALSAALPQQAEITLSHLKPARHLAVEAVPLASVSGGHHALVICRDVTRLRQLEDVRREFVANVSHELRTPLAIFQGYIENLLDHPSVPEAELVEVLHVLKRHSTRLNALVEDLLDLARLESRSEILCIEALDPRALVAKTLDDWRIRARNKQIDFAAECAAGAPRFQADAARLEQVFNNLVENAIKYTDAGGRVQLLLAPCDAGIEIRVADTGAGIPPQDLPHIFERFYRADKARTRQQGGTGLGLSIVKHVVQLHGGTIRAESTYGKGTTVILTLPLVPRAVPVAPAGS